MRTQKSQSESHGFLAVVLYPLQWKEGVGMGRMGQAPLISIIPLATTIFLAEIGMQPNPVSDT